MTMTKNKTNWIPAFAGMTGAKNLIAFYSIVNKEVTRFMRIWTQTLLPSAITSILYFMIFGSLIGSRIGLIDGISYMQFIVPGLIMLAVINNAYSNVVFSFFSAKFQKNIEEILVSPTPNIYILLGYLSGGVLRALLSGIIVTIVALFFTSIPLVNWWLMAAVLILTATLFASAGLINAIYANSFDSVNIVPTFILGPLTYLGGIFYSIHMLPPFWQHLSFANPILYIINAFRYSLLGVSDISIALAMSLIIGLNIILFGVALYLLEKGIGLKK
jgi:ABC-2 type transport system permease protein